MRAQSQRPAAHLMLAMAQRLACLLSPSPPPAAADAPRCEQNRVDFLFGLARNARLVEELAIDLAWDEHEATRTRPNRHLLEAATGGVIHR